jgi:hypothetical protein
MGGYGSGRASGRDKVKACRSIDVNRLHRQGCLSPGWQGSWSWTQDGQRVAFINMYMESARLVLSYRVRIGSGDWEDIKGSVPIVGVACRFGSSRPYFLLPRDG